jgi:hypothetical protein
MSSWSTDPAKPVTLTRCNNPACDQMTANTFCCPECARKNYRQSKRAGHPANLPSRRTIGKLSGHDCL